MDTKTYYIKDLHRFYKLVEVSGGVHLVYIIKEEIGFSIIAEVISIKKILDKCFLSRFFFSSKKKDNYEILIRTYPRLTDTEEYNEDRIQ